MCNLNACVEYKLHAWQTAINRMTSSTPNDIDITSSTTIHFYITSSANTQMKMITRLARHCDRNWLSGIFLFNQLLYRVLPIHENSIHVHLTAFQYGIILLPTSAFRKYTYRASFYFLISFFFNLTEARSSALSEGSTECIWSGSIEYIWSRSIECKWSGSRVRVAFFFKLETI